LFSDVSNFEFDSDFQSMNGIDLVGARFQDWRVPKSFSFQNA